MRLAALAPAPSGDRGWRRARAGADLALPPFLPSPLASPHPLALAPLPRSTIVRPTHTSIPPTLLDLPFPLPLAPPSSRLAPFIPRPPPLADTDTPDGDAHAGPPTYTREADGARGESTLEGGFLEGELEVIAYEAGLLEDDDVLEMLRMQHPRTS